jgi:hypothetical protein
VAKADIEPAGQSPTRQTDLATPSVGDLEPVRPGSAARTIEKTAPVGPGLVAVSDSGAHALSILYPRADYGIIQVDKVMPEEVRLKTPFTYVITVTNLTETMLTEITLSETLSREFEFKGPDPAAKRKAPSWWEIDPSG